MPLPRRPGGKRRRRTPAIRGIVLAAALALVGLAAYVVWPSGPAPHRPPGPLDPTRDTVVFLGNSITSGHGLPLEVAFPHRLGTALGVPTLNAGLSGDTTEGGRRRLEADVLAHQPKLVVVELGVNDAFRRLPRERTIENLRSITRQIRETGAGVILTHIRLPNIVGDGYRQDLRDIARSEGAWLIEDFLDDVVPQLTTDGLHPNREGHARLAARLEPVLRGILGL